MHNIDRTLTETETETGEWLGEEEADTEAFEFSAEPEVGELDPEAPFDEVIEMELAANLLEVSDEEELDQFLGGLMKKASRFMKSSTGRALGGMLRGLAKKALPLAGRAIGTAFGGPAGGAIGGNLAATAGKMFGLEIEGMSQEDQQYEVARRIVRLAGSAAQKAAQASPNTPPEAAAKAAVIAAARRHAPGLVGRGGGDGASGSRSGRWIRRGRKIIVLGA